jgi:hypothetical protein
MTTLDQMISDTQLYQDVELATAIGELKANPGQLQRFLQDQQSTVFNSVTQQKDNTFQKVYGDLDRATKVQEAVLMYNRRNKDLHAIQEQVYQNQKNSASAVLEDKSLAGRKYEMNEWSVGNKEDTLFVFSSLFIMLSGLLLITGLWRLGMISSALWIMIGAPLIFIFMLIVIRRTQYTDVTRDKRYWNKQAGAKYGGSPIPMCPDVGTSMENITNAVGSAASSVAAGVAAAGAAMNTTGNAAGAAGNPTGAAANAASTANASTARP